MYVSRDRVLIEKDNTSLLYKNKYYFFWYRFAFNYNTITNFYTARKLGESYANWPPSSAPLLTIQSPLGQVTFFETS